MKVLIVDDEEPARTRMQRLLTEFDDAEVVGLAENGAIALQKIGKLQPDVVFLDIEMPVLNGMEVAATIGDSTRIVFVTAYDEFAIKAFDAGAVDYLVKPVDKERLRETWKRLQSNRPSVPLDVLTERVTKIGVRSGNKILALALSEISAFIASGEYTETFCGESRHLIDDTLAGLESRLDPKKFLRIHRSAIINLDFLSELVRLGDRKYSAKLNDYFATEAPISRDSLAAVKSWLGLS